ncbi:hypothetical protein ACOMD4_10185 [Streptomyces anulatus]|uniref:hypothetical protein n=1 Tax=Streptomyces anulatus TaxID=1892 RepID=UPI003B7A2DB3
MRTFPLRLPSVLVLGGALLLPLGTVQAQAAPAAEPSWRDTAVANGDFSSPALSETDEKSQEAVPTQWSGSDVMIFSGPLARRSDKKQAVSLNDSTGPGILRQRLWNVNAGATVRVSFDDSASTLSTCTPARVADGQRYKASTYKAVEYGPDGKPSKDRKVHHTQEYKTAGYTKPANQTGEGSWSASPKTFEFTAADDNPLIAFESLEKPTGSDDAEKKCGPLVAKVSAQQKAAAINYYVPQDGLPWHAYEGHDEISLETALATCKGVDGCRFTADPDYSYQYYDKVRVIGHAAINCTRNQKSDKRSLKYTEEGFDSITQEVRRLKDLAQVDQNLGNDGGDDKGSGSPNLQEAYPNMFKQAAAGFQRNQGNSRLANTTDPLTTTRTTDKTVEQAVQPSEASWFEVQPSRERVEGIFTGSKGVRIDAMLDYPSNRVPDRFYQRTGPMTQDEQKHCLTERPLRVTPDNTGVDARSEAGGTTRREAAPTTGSGTARSENSGAPAEAGAAAPPNSPAAPVQVSPLPATTVARSESLAQAPAPQAQQ